MLKNLNSFLSILYMLLNFDLFLSINFTEISPVVINQTTKEEIDSWTNKQTVHFSKSLDMGLCTCDITNHCDFRCCCDQDCNDDKTSVDNWKKEGICLNKNNNRMEKYKCYNRKNSFFYNKDEAGIFIKDHIFNIMCIETDNSQDMGEFYLDEYDHSQVEKDKNAWMENFFESPPPPSENFKYNDAYNLTIYRPDTNGNCVRANIYFLKPFESSCIYNGQESLIYDQGDTTNRYGDRKITEISHILIYRKVENFYQIKERKINIVRMNVDSNIIKFKVEWIDENYNNKTLPTTYGYLQGNPIKIAEKNNNNGYSYYANGFNIPSSNKNRECIMKNDNDIENSINFNKILFKTNHMFSCKYRGEPNNTYIYENICKELKVAIATNSSLSDISNSKSWIDINPQDDCKRNFLEGKDINIQLIILTSKEGKENQPYEYIKYAKFFFSNSDKRNSEPIISFKVKFIDLSFNSIENSKNNKITSFSSLPSEIIDILTDKSGS